VESFRRAKHERIALARRTASHLIGKALYGQVPRSDLDPAPSLPLKNRGAPNLPASVIGAAIILCILPKTDSFFRDTPRWGSCAEINAPFRRGPGPIARDCHKLLSTAVQRHDSFTCHSSDLLVKSRNIMAFSLVKPYNHRPDARHR
jgi:hypothetical protein